MPDTRPGPLELAAKLYARVRSRGAAEVLSLVKARIKETINSHDELIVYVRDSAGLGESPAWPDLKEATPADGLRYERDVGTDSATTFAKRLSETTRCFFIESDGRIVHATWMTTRAAWTRELHGYFRPPEGDGYVYESYTRPEVRGQGIYPRALEQISARMAALELEHVWVAVEAHNHSSQRAVTKGGFNEAWRVSYGRRFGRVRVDPPTGPMADLGARSLVLSLGD